MTAPEHLHTLVIVNPASAGGATRRRWEKNCRLLQREIGPFEYAFTCFPGHATVLTARALASGFRRVVAVGGDGTFNEVVSGFFREGQAVLPQAVFGFIPLGTGSDFARTFGLTTPEQACAFLKGHASQAIDVGWARFAGHDGRTTERIVLNEISVGCSGRVAQRLGSGLKRAAGSLAYPLAALSTLANKRDAQVSIAIDDGTPQPMAITNCAVCNGRYFGGGMLVAPQAAVDDGWFDITVWSGFGLADLVCKRRGLYDGTHVHEPGTRLLRARNLTASSREDVLVEVDGESLGRLPVRIEMLPQALRVMAALDGKNARPKWE
jgi:YegS/Rv2252/BmrU family lipid kinase